MSQPNRLESSLLLINCTHYRWHFVCTDLQTLFSITLSIEQDPVNDDNTVQSTIVDGLGFYAVEESAPLGFYIDEISFASESREFHHDLVS